MGQNPGSLSLAKNPSGASVPVQVDANGALLVGSPNDEGVNTTLNVSAATVIKNSPGKVLSINVVVAGAAGTVNDCATTGAAAAANEIAVTPAVVGPINLNWTCKTGIVVVPGAAQVLAVQWK